MQIASISAAACDELLAVQATTYQGAPIGRQGILPVTEQVWHDYYRARLPARDLPWWSCRTATADAFEGILFVDPSLAVFRGHFPGNPILPGVVQIDWAVSAAQEAFEQTPADRFRGMSRIKFKAPVAPASWLRLRLNRTDHSVHFEFRDAVTTRTQGQLHYHA